ncbi:MAG: HEAT repeat domain-containing protein [Candidatus Firestonebacteria bacterium]
MIKRSIFAIIFFTVFSCFAQETEKLPGFSDKNLSDIDVNSIKLQIKRMNSSYSKAYREEARDILIKMGNSALPYIVSALNDNDFIVRGYALEIIGESRDKKYTNTIAKVLEKNSDVYIKCKAIEALGKIKDPIAVKILLKYLKNESKNVQYFAIWSIGEIGDNSYAKELWFGEKRQTIVKELKPLLQSDDFYTKYYTIEALGKIKDTSSLTQIREILRHSDAGIRGVAAASLGVIGDSVVIPDLIVIIERDYEFSVRYKAAESLGKFKDINTIFVLLKMFKDIESSNHLVGEIGLEKAGEIAIPALIEILKDGNWQVQLSTIKLIGKIGSSSALPVLVEKLKDDNFLIKMSAINSIGQIGTEEAINILKNITDESLKKYAQDAIINIRK